MISVSRSGEDNCMTSMGRSGKNKCVTSVGRSGEDKCVTTGVYKYTMLGVAMPFASYTSHTYTHTRPHVISYVYYWT